MARPKKQRMADGIALVDNLYQDPRKRAGYFRYQRKDGSNKIFQAPDVETANAIATKSNEMRDTYEPAPENAPQRHQTAFHFANYITHREELDPSLKSKRSWDNRRYAINQLSKQFPTLQTLEQAAMRQWWNQLTYHQQKLRRAEFWRLFNWLMIEELCPKIKYNPFTKSDDKPQLERRAKAPVQRPKTTQAHYDVIHEKAGELGYESLQIAMAISRYTTLRESDIVGLRWDTNIKDSHLRVTVSKSEAQKGTARAARLYWDLDQHPTLAELIERCRTRAEEHRDCPFIISHRPRRKVWNNGKEHLYQLTADRLSRMFRETRDTCGIDGIAFHGIRGLAITLLRQEGYSNEEIKHVTAHEDTATTKGYQNADELPYDEVTLKLTR